MTILMRLLNLTGRPLHVSHRRATTAAVLLAVTAAAIGAFAAPAGATVTEVGGASVGLQARNYVSVRDGLIESFGGGFFENPEAETFANASGNPVLHATNVRVIYWDPGNPATKTNYYHNDWVKLIDKFLVDMGGTNGNLEDVFAVDGQYTDKTNQPAGALTSFRGSYEDDAPYPTAECTDPRPFEAVNFHKIVPLGCVTDAQIQQELKSFVALHALPTGLGQVYYVLTPPGLAVCLDGGGSTGHCSDFSATKLEEEEHKLESTSYENSFCSYHSDINPTKSATGDANTILYGVIPWTAGGFGDGQLAVADQTPGYYCQDGGFDPTSSPIERREKAKEENKKQKEEFSEKSAEEKQPLEEARLAAGPHEQEPNQVPCPSEDGYCDTGLADLIIGQLANEQQNIVTDPLLNAWHDTEGSEVTDECRNFFAPTRGGSVDALPVTKAGTLFNQQYGADTYYLNAGYDAAAAHLNFPGVPCLLGVNLAPAFNDVTPVNSAEIVDFNGMESDITLNAATDFTPAGAPQTTYATYIWNFGDGTPAVTGFAPGAPKCEVPWQSPCAASVFHAFQYGGTYIVTLTVKDVAGNLASVSHEVTVVGPPKPAPPAGPGATPQSTPSAAASLSATGKPVAAPVAAAAIVTRTLPLALRKGVSVRYSVNEQVAGHFEILLAKSVAHRLHIGGAPATGMAPGSTPQIVIGKAILITTKGGHSTVTIKLSKRTAAGLGRTRKVALTLRLIVRNAAVKNPLTTTVVSTATLTR